MKKEFLKNGIFCCTDENHKFTVDALILASLCPKAEKVLDFCAGTGIIGLSLLDLKKASAVSFCDISEKATSLIILAVSEQKLNADIFTGDARLLFNENEFDLAVFNPPYFRYKSGKEPTKKEISLQKFEKDGCIEDFILLSLKTAKKAVFSIVSSRKDEVGKTLEKHNIPVTAVYDIHHDEKSIPFMTVYEICREKAKTNEQKLFLKQNGEYTDFYKNLYRG